MSSTPEVLYEDEHLLALNKPSGLLTEGGAEREDDLEQAARRHAGKQVYCCHRLDRLTSGVVLLRKSGLLKRELAELFAGRRLRKQYWALVDGLWDGSLQRVESRIDSVGKGIWANVESGGKEALTTFRLLGRDASQQISLIELLLKTGRTHQARLHCLKAGCPILGDPVYGEGEPSQGLFGLHARELRLAHPLTGEALSIVAAPPREWQPLLERFDLAKSP